MIKQIFGTPSDLKKVINYKVVQYVELYNFDIKFFFT